LAEVLGEKGHGDPSLLGYVALYHSVSGSGHYEELWCPGADLPLS